MKLSSALRLLEQMWTAGRARRAQDNDYGDMGTAFGLEASLAAESDKARTALGSAQNPQPAPTRSAPG